MANRERIERAIGAATVNLRHVEASEQQRKAQQGLGKPIISAEFAGQRVIAVSNTVYFNQSWKTFPDFLLYFVGKVLGREWGNAELAKAETDMHPVALWHRKICQLQAAHVVKPGEVFGAPETGAARAHLELSYNLYLLEHNAELRGVLVSRLKEPRQFLGALSEIRVAGMLVRAGFSVKFHDESDSSTTHCEYDAAQLSSGKSFSVEVKTRHWETFPRNDPEGCQQVRVSVGRLLRDALSKDAAHDRLVFIELAMPDEAPANTPPSEPWWMQAAMDGVRDTEQLLKQQGRAIPGARVIVSNHPHHFHLDSTRSLVGYSLDGMGPTDFRSGQMGTVREVLRFRERHGALLAIWSSIQKHREIPQTFDGRSHHLAFGDHPPQLMVGQRYGVPDAKGALITATLEDAVVLPSEKSVHGIYRTDDGQQVICTSPLTDAEAKAFAEQPDTFFGVVKRQTPINDPMELYDFFFASYGQSSKDALLKLMSDRPDIEALRTLPREELAEVYCESLVNAVLQRAGAAEQSPRSE